MTNSPSPPTTARLGLLTILLASTTGERANHLYPRKDTAHPYESALMDPETQHTPLDPSTAHLRPPPPRLSSTAQDATIFVGSVSFRDARRCAITMLTAFGRARHPERIRFGVVDQVFKEDERCIDAYCKIAREEWPERAKTDDCPYRAQIRIDERDAVDSRGPMYARHYQQKLIQDEEFCIETDSHSIYTNDWDVAMIEEWLATDNEMSVLTTYVHHSADAFIKSNGENNPPIDTPHICDVRKGAHGVPRNEGATNLHNMTRPIMTSRWGAGFSFSKCHSERRVLFDPNALWIFDGEEFLRAALLWTSGYDMYSPTGRGHAVYHNYTAVPALYHNLKVDKKQRRREEEMGANRIKLHIGQAFTGLVSTEDLEVYSGSRVRHMDQFLEFSGVYFQDGRNWSHRCYQLHWVPFVHPEEIETLLPGWRQFGSAAVAADNTTKKIDTSRSAYEAMKGSADSCFDVILSGVLLLSNVILLCGFVAYIMSSRRRKKS